MANTSRVYGLRPVRHVDGSPWNGKLGRYFVPASDSTAIFQGDLVKLGGALDSTGVPTVAKFVAGTDSAAVGVAVGFSINPLNLNSPQYRAASTAQYVLIADGVDTVYEIQSGVAATPTTLTQNAQVADAGGSTTTGQSGMTITSFATTATLPLKCLGAVQRVDNDITSNNYKVLVTINNHQLAAGTGTAGV